uniref:6-pyruvoyl trahydropterin synthase family protein n=1 Tax=Barnesiella intestinihominis TaxID=487174 RepID=UPI003AB2B8FE
MYYVAKTMEIAGAHSLHLSYESKCEKLHGHNWIITVYCKAKELNQDGMVCDFKHIKGEFYQFNLSSCIRQQNSLTAQFVSFSLSNLANIFYPP